MFKNYTIYYIDNINLNEVIKTQNLKSIYEPLMVFDLEKIKEKFYIWKKYMPDIKPFYGEICNKNISKSFIIIFYIFFLKLSNVITIH